MSEEKEFIKQQRRLQKHVPALIRITDQEVLVLPGAFYFKNSKLVIRVDAVSENILEDVIHSFANSYAFYADEAWEEYDIMQKILDADPQSVLDYDKMVKIFPLGVYVPFLEELGVEDPR
jgi:hypothetical protein